MAYIKGNDLIISKAEGSAIAASKTCEINMNCDLKEISSPSSGAFKEFMAGRKEWSVSLQYMVPAEGTTVMNRILSVGKTYTLTCKVRGSATDTLSGTAICTECKITATRGNMLTGNFSFKGTGPLE